MYTRLFLTLVCTVATILSGCTSNKEPTQTHRAFYYWKSVFVNSPETRSAIKKLRVEALYIKFFDVDLLSGKPMPVAPIEFRDKPDTDQLIIPTVFITQSCINSLNQQSATVLATQIGSLIEKIAVTAGIKKIEEIQIDCDWTAKNTSAYFTLLKTMKALPLMQGKTLSVTIRLYQLKYISKVGIPPADRGMLMCYNMGDLKNPNADNSILSVSVLKEYLPSIRTYPLLLDVALPLFQWDVLFRGGTYKGLIRDFDPIMLKTIAVEQKSNNFVVQTDTTVGGYSFLRGDVLRHETISSDELDETATLLSSKLAPSPRTVSFFHLDSEILSRYDIPTLDKLYRRF